MANEKRLELINKWDVVNKLIQLENNYNFYKDVWDAQTLYRRICELEIGIGKTPTVDAVEVVHAKWENIRFITTGDGRTKVGDCSSCKSIERVRNYCPNCGAKMDGERRKVIETDL